jgi:hypothetical protein
VTGDLRKLHNEELHNLYSSPSITRIIKSRRMRWAGHKARMGILVGKPEGKRPLIRPRRRWVDSIKMGLREVGRDGVDWIDTAQGPVEGSCEHGVEPSGFRKYWEVLEYLLKKGSAL